MRDRDPWAPEPAATEDEAQLHKRQQRERDDVRIETNAMATAFNAFQPLGEEARYRGLAWLRHALDLPSRDPKEPPF